MMVGVVNADLEAILRLTLVGLDAREVEIEAAVDTGFNNDLALAAAVIESLGWRFNDSNITKLGDGSEREMRYFRGIVLWHGRPRLIDVLEAESKPLVGSGLISGGDLFIRMKPNGEVRITEIA